LQKTEGGGWKKERKKEEVVSFLERENESVVTVDHNESL